MPPRRGRERLSWSNTVSVQPLHRQNTWTQKMCTLECCEVTRLSDGRCVAQYQRKHSGIAIIFFDWAFFKSCEQPCGGPFWTACITELWAIYRIRRKIHILEKVSGVTFCRDTWNQAQVNYIPLGLAALSGRLTHLIIQHWEIKRLQVLAVWSNVI